MPLMSAALSSNTVSACTSIQIIYSCRPDIQQHSASKSANVLSMAAWMRANRLQLNTEKTEFMNCVPLGAATKYLPNI